MILINGYLHTMDGDDIPNGYIQVQDSTIQAIGHMSTCPSLEGQEVFDVQGGHILPGMIDAHCHLGMFGNGLGFEADDGNESTDPITPHIRGLDGVNPMDHCFAEARAGGVTTVFTGPGSANPIGGQFLAMKTAGTIADEMAIIAPLAMKFALGENPKSVYNDRKETPMTRMGTTALIREWLTKGNEYQSQINRAKEDEDSDPPDFDPKLAALTPILDGTMVSHFHAHRADDMATALRIAKEFSLKPVLIHGTEGHLIADFLAKEGVSIITGPFLGDRSKPELVNMQLDNTAILHKAGVEVAICTDHPCTPIQQLPLCAAMAVRAGLDEREALRAITITPAKIGGLDHRIGSLTAGKDADIVVTAGHPLDWKSAIVTVFINGQKVS